METGYISKHHVVSVTQIMLCEYKIVFIELSFISSLTQNTHISNVLRWSWTNISFIVLCTYHFIYFI